MPNQFTSSALLIVGYEAQTVANFKDVLEKRDLQTESVHTELQIIRSQELAEEVIEKLNLRQDPEFNPILGREAGTVWPLAWIEDFITTEASPSLISRSVGQDRPHGDDDRDVAQEGRIEREHALVLERFLSKMDVSLMEGSRAVSLSFTSLDPVKAAQIAGAIANSYLERQVREKVVAAEKATTWLKNKISEVRENVDESERAAERYKKEVAQRDVSGRVEMVAAQLVAAQAAKREAQVRYKQLQTVIGSEGVAAASEIIDSPLLLSLRAKEGDLRRQAAELSQHVGELHPQMVSVRAELESLKREMASAVNKTLERYKIEVRTEEENEQVLQDNLEILKSVDAADFAAVQLQELEREADVNKQMLQRLLARYKETSAQTDVDIHLPQARIISKATIPLKSSWPPRALFIAGLLVSSMLISSGIAFALERLRSGFSNGGEVQASTGFRLFGVFPEVAGKALGNKPPTSYIVDHPRSDLATAMRTISINIFLHEHNFETRSLLVTSSTSAEGKSTLAASLAVMGASAGKRVVVVDCDLRQPFMHKWATISEKPGVAEYVLGGESVIKVLHRDRSSGLYVIPSGSLEGDPAVVLSSPKIAELLNILRKQFDMVIVDSPPVMMASDSIVMAAQVDMTVLVVRSGKTSRDVVQYSLNQLQAVGANVGGTVLSLVNARGYTQYRYGEPYQFSPGPNFYYDKQKKTLPEEREPAVDVLRLTRRS